MEMDGERLYIIDTEDRSGCQWGKKLLHVASPQYPKLQMNNKAQLRTRNPQFFFPFHRHTKSDGNFSELLQFCQFIKLPLW